MDIVILDGFTANPGDLSWAEIEALGSLTVYDRTPPELVLERIGGAQIVYTNKTVLGRDMIAQMPNVRFIGVLATGYNVVDVEAASERGITVCNIPAYSTDAVAQLVFALLLDICHHAAEHSQAVHSGRWINSEDFCFWDYPLMELAGKTMGIIGYGRIGKRVAEIARAFRMRVLATSAHPDAEGCSPLDTVLAQSDVISLHCPLTQETRGLICADTIAKMKDGVIIINTARGPLINESELKEALQSGKVYSAGVDVVSEEPMRGDNPLLGLQGCVITPHIGWAPKESRIRLIGIAADNLCAYLEGRPVNVVSR